MSDEDTFFRRWSRLKTEGPAPEDPEAPEDPPPELPSLDSLGGDSDYTPFLHKAVPAALRVAALRIAWRSDPEIAGFKGLADYDWDCNAPGYGKLLPTDDMRALCDRVLGHLAGKAEDEPSEAEDKIRNDPA